MIVTGFGLFGKNHAVQVATREDGTPYVPRRAKPPLCGGRRVMCTSTPFLADDPESCKLCIEQLPEGGWVSVWLIYGVISTIAGIFLLVCTVILAMQLGIVGWIILGAMLWYGSRGASRWLRVKTVPDVSAVTVERGTPPAASKAPAVRTPSPRRERAPRTPRRPIEDDLPYPGCTTSLDD